MSVIGLPVNLGAVADVAEKRESGGRFSLATVELSVKTDTVEIPPPTGCEGPVHLVTTHSYRAAATDCKRLVMIEGEALDTDEVPGLDAVRTAPNSATRAMVPAKEFKKVFGDAAKGTRGFSARNCRQVLASLSPDVATFGFTDTESEQVKRTTLVAGKFPPVAEIVADTKKKAKVKFAVDPKQLAELAKIAAGFCDDENMRLEIETAGDGKPLLMTATNGGQKLTMLLMPLGG